MKRSRELRPLSSEHHQALLVAFQVKKGLEGHAEAAGAPRDLPGLLSLARRFERQVFASHAEAEEALLSPHLSDLDRGRLAAEHVALKGMVEQAGSEASGPRRAALASFAELLERHVRWEERELFPWAEAHLDAAELARIGTELEKRLVLAGQGSRGGPR